MKTEKDNLPPSANSIPLVEATLTERDRLIDLSQSFTAEEMREKSRRYQEGILGGTVKRLNKGKITDPVRIEFCLGCIKDQDLLAELEAHPRWSESRKRVRKNVEENY